MFDSCDPMDCSPPVSSVHGISQARILDWVAFSCSRDSSQPRDQTLISCTGRQILHCWATREAPNVSIWIAKPRTHFITAKLLSVGRYWDIDMALPQLLGKQQWDCSSGILRLEIISFPGDHMDHLWEETRDNQKSTHPSVSLVLVGIICLVYWYTKVRAILTQALKPRPAFVSQLAHQPPLLPQ